MKKTINVTLLALALSLSCANFCYAKQQPKQPADIELSDQLLAPDSDNEDVTDAETQAPDTVAPQLVAPVVVDPKLDNPEKTNKNGSSKRINLNAVMFDPDADFKAEAKEEGREMTRLEMAQDNIHEALHGSVSAVSATPLMNDKWTMKFAKGPIASITPWVDYSGVMGSYYTADNYANTLFRTRFQDVGINGKFRNGKTVFRIMVNTGMEVANNTYMQSFFFDNYIMHSLSKSDQVLVGYARTAVGAEGGESPYTIPFVNRSQTATAYGNVRALGTKFQGKHDLYDYSVGLFSSGRWFHDVFAGPEFVGQFSVKPLGKTDGRFGKVTLGGGVNAGKVDSRYTVGTAYAQYEYKRMRATLEYGSADGSNGAAGLTKNQSEGYNGTLAYRITPKLEALVRYDVFDPNKQKMNDIRRECTTGFNYFVKGQALKMMFNYTVYSVENGTFGSRILLGTQIIL